MDRCKASATRGTPDPRSRGHFHVKDFLGRAGAYRICGRSRRGREPLKGNSSHRGEISRIGSAAFRRGEALSRHSPTDPCRPPSEARVLLDSPRAADTPTARSRSYATSRLAPSSIGARSSIPARFQPRTTDTTSSSTTVTPMAIGANCRPCGRRSAGRSLPIATAGSSKVAAPRKPAGCAKNPAPTCESRFKTHVGCIGLHRATFAIEKVTLAGPGPPGSALALPGPGSRHAPFR